MNNRRVLTALVLLAELPWSTSSQAQSVNSDSTQLKEVVVTAEHRVADVQKTSASISVRSGDDLLQAGRYGLAAILEDIPGVAGAPATAYGAGSDLPASGISIRGVQSNVGSAGSVVSPAPAIASYTDGVYGGIGGNYDIDRVEVLRGPQGTLYGRSATAGVIATYTRDPEIGEMDGNASVEFGDYSLQHYTGALNVPLGNTVAVRVSGNQYERDGYVSAAGGALRTSEGRAKLLYQPTERISILFGYALQDNRTHTGGTSVYLTSPDSYGYSSLPVGTGSNEFRQYWARLEWNLGPAALTYEPALRTWSEDATNYSVCCGGAIIRVPYSTPADRYVTHELRLASNGHSKLTWQLGGLYYDNNMRNYGAGYFEASNAVTTIADTSKKTAAWGIFGETTYAFAASWRATTGVRYDHTPVETSQVYTFNLNVGANPPPGSPNFSLPVVLQTETLSGQEGARRFSNLTYKARLEHDLTVSNLVYAAVATGFTPGDVQVANGAGNRPIAVPYDEETLTSYEIGSKNRFLHDSLQINGDVYFNSYGGYQTSSVSISGNHNAPAFALLSVPVRMKGAELEILYRLTPDDRLSLSYSYVDGYYVDESTLFRQSVAQTHIVGTPPQTANVAYDHALRLPGGSHLTLHGDARLLSANDIYFIAPQDEAAGAGPYARVGDQVVGDLNATWNSIGNRYSVSVYVRNVGDNRYKTGFSSDAGIQSNTPSILATVVPYEPRTYGLILNANF